MQALCPGHDRLEHTIRRERGGVESPYVCTQAIETRFGWIRYRDANLKPVKTWPII